MSAFRVVFCSVLISSLVVGCKDRESGDSAKNEIRSKKVASPVVVGSHRESLRTPITDRFVEKWVGIVPSGIDPRLAGEIARDPLAAVIRGAHDEGGFGVPERTFASYILINEKEYAAMASILFELPKDFRPYWMRHFLTHWNRSSPSDAASWVMGLRERSPDLFKRAYPTVAREMVEEDLELFRETILDDSRPEWEREMAGRVAAEQIASTDGPEAALEIVEMLPEQLRSEAREGILLEVFSGEESLPMLQDLILSAPLTEAPELYSLFLRIEQETNVRVAMQFADELRARDQENPNLKDALVAPYNSWARKDWEGAVEWLFGTDNLTKGDRLLLAEEAVVHAQTDTPGVAKYLPQLTEILGQKKIKSLAGHLDARQGSKESD